MGKTVVWVQASVLAAALGKGTKESKKKDSIDLDRGGSFGWTRCELLSGDISALDSSALDVRIFDDGSENDGESVTIAADLVKPDKPGEQKVVMANEWDAAEVSGDKGVGVPPDDLITLTHLHEPSVVYCLRQRYGQDLIYTSTGPILIALNPFKALPGLYDDVMMTDHWMAGEKVAELDLKPHIYQSAHAAFRSMMQGIEMQTTGVKDAVSDQSMLVSGESGAGKTVTTKHVMKYLATLSQRKAEFGKRRRDASPGRSEPRGPRRSMSIRASRALSWKAGALVEERSKCLPNDSVNLMFTSCTHGVVCLPSFFQFSTPTPFLKLSETLGRSGMTTPRGLESSLSCSSNKPVRWSEPASKHTSWRRFVWSISQRVKETTTYSTSCWLLRWRMSERSTCLENLLLKISR